MLPKERRSLGLQEGKKKEKMGTEESAEEYKLAAEETRGEEGAHQAAAEGAVAAMSPPAFEEADIEEVERILGYRFHDRALVEEALTHVSFHQPAADPTGVEEAQPSYERLEFVGDAVLNCVVARELFTVYRQLPPGPLTKLRAANVDTEKLARVAVGGGLHRFLRHRAPYLDGQIQEFMEDISEYPVHSNGLLDPPKVLADIVESLLGAVFVDSDSDLEAVWKVFKRLSEPLISLEMLGKHPKTELYELCQKKGMTLSFLKDAWMESTAVEVLVDGNLVGRATYGNKKEVALNRAAKAALDHLKLIVLVDEGGTGGGGGSAVLSQHLQEEMASDGHPPSSDETCMANVC